MRGGHEPNLEFLRNGMLPEDIEDAIAVEVRQTGFPFRFTSAAAAG